MSALEHKVFVSQALQELEENRCILKVPDCPYICSPLSVVVNAQRKLRLVINLRYLNQFLWNDKLSMIAMLLFKKGDFFRLTLNQGITMWISMNPIDNS